MSLPERREPTHELTIRVPLNLAANPTSAHDIQDAFQQAMNALLPVIRLGTLGVWCGDTMVEVADLAEPGQAQGSSEDAG